MAAGRSMAPEKNFGAGPHPDTTIVGGNGKARFARPNQYASGHNDRPRHRTAHLCLPACIPLLSAPRVKTETGMGRGELTTV